MAHDTTTFCRICEAQCGLTVRVNGDRINANILAADGPDAIEPISGMAHFNGILVSVEPLP